MAIFYYRAVDTAGQVVQGSLEAKSDRFVVQQLHQNRLIPLNISQEELSTTKGSLWPYSDSGFTLLELLLAILLLSFLGFAVFTGINLCIKVYRSQVDDFTKTQELRVAWRYFERSLSSAGDRLKTEGPWPYFVGKEQEIRFITPIPLEAHNLGGFYYWRVWVGKDEDGWGSLVVDESKIVQWQDNPKVETRQVLLHGIRNWQFLFSAKGKEYTQWDGLRLNGLPQIVKVRFNREDNAPQEWLIPLHAAVLSADNE